MIPILNYYCGSWYDSVNVICLDDLKSPYRSATISGPHEGIERAHKMVQDIISEVTCYNVYRISMVRCCAL